ncbi:PTS fructose transporter subunit IIB [Vibrio lentus]|nr:PTS fructose transporter subunit IIB [Vibrio lentus]
MKIVAVTACPTGIAHTYMAADALNKTAHKFNISIKVETQGAMGIENLLSAKDITLADKIMIVSDIDIEQPNRFDPAKTVLIPMEDVLLNVERVFIKHGRVVKHTRDAQRSRS